MKRANMANTTKRNKQLLLNLFRGRHETKPNQMEFVSLLRSIEVLRPDMNSIALNLVLDAAVWISDMKLKEEFPSEVEAVKAAFVWGKTFALRFCITQNL